MKIKDAEKILKALANKRRLAILRYLKINKLATVGTIAKAINLSFKSTSKHLVILTNADILKREQRSLMVIYEFCDKLDPITKNTLSNL